VAFSYSPQMKRAEGGDDSDIPLDERDKEHEYNCNNK